jgi:hypothetical protein
MRKDLVRIGALKRARDLAGGVSFLARRIGVGVNSLDAMIQGHEEVPAWVFIAAVDFIRQADETGAVPPGFPPNWEGSVRYDDSKP